MDVPPASTFTGSEARTRHHAGGPLRTELCSAEFTIVFGVDRTTFA
jgi:hypothetical protein